jgi:hypothetical protein
LGPYLEAGAQFTKIDWAAADRQHEDGLAAVLAGVKEQFG